MFKLTSVVLVLVLLLTSTSCSSQAQDLLAPETSSETKKSAPLIHLAIQDGQLSQFVSSTDLKNTAVHSDDVLVISGYALGAGYNVTKQRFFSLSKFEIGILLDDYLQRQKSDKSSHGYVVLDIEHPIHPSKFYKLDEAQIAELVNAFERRIAIARSRFPNAKIGLYGMFTASSRCNTSTLDKKRLASLIKFYVRLNSVQAIDFATAVSYLRSHKNKRGKNLNACIAKKNIDAINRMQEYGLDLVPMMNFRLINSNSNFHKNKVEYADNNYDYLMQSLLEKSRIYTAAGVKKLFYWTAKPDLNLKQDPAWKVSDILNIIAANILIDGKPQDCEFNGRPDADCLFRN